MSAAAARIQAAEARERNSGDAPVLPPPPKVYLDKGDAQPGSWGSVEGFTLGQPKKKERALNRKVGDTTATLLLIVFK